MIAAHYYLMHEINLKIDQNSAHVENLLKQI